MQIHFISKFLSQNKTKPSLFCYSCLHILHKIFIFVDNNNKVHFIHGLIKDKIINLYIKQNKYLISKVGESTSVGESTKHPGKKRERYITMCVT